MLKDTVIELDISGLNHQGEGVGRWKGLAVFVPLTVPGDRARAVITEVRKNFARGRLQEVMAPSQFRRETQCSYAVECGGCQLQQIDYQQQLELKAGLVKESMRRIGKLDGVEVRPVLGMDDPWHYRNKVVFQVRGTEQAVLGLYESGSNVLGAAPFSSGDELATCSGCRLVNRELNLVAAQVQDLLRLNRVAAWDGSSHQGLMQQVMLRRGLGTGQIMVALITGPGPWAGAGELAAAIKERCPDVVSVVRIIRSSRAGREKLENTVLLAGRPHIIDRLAGLQYQISPTSFYQVNSVQTSVLYHRVLAYAALTGPEKVLDAYCGVGTIALYLSRRAGRVLALEVVTEAVRDAIINARLNGITNVEFTLGDAAKVMPALAGNGFKPDCVVLDPPRRGCAPEVLEAVAGMSPARVVYVSCDPGTLARDLARLVPLGYRVAEIQPVDMFPHTAHVESVCLLEIVSKIISFATFRK